MQYVEKYSLPKYDNVDQSLREGGQKLLNLEH